MKLKFLLVLFVLLLVPFYSCHTSQEQNNISQIRNNVFYGEENGICIKAYSEEKEYPFINDGIANNRENFVIVKVLNFYEDTNLTLQFSGKSYSAKAQYNPTSNSMDCTFLVKSLPNKELVVLAENNGNKTQITCKSLLKSDTISPLTALEKANSQQQEFVSSLYENGTFKAEIYIRLICEGDYNFYYVGYGQGNNKITAFLLDGITGEILAGKYQ